MLVMCGSILWGGYADSACRPAPTFLTTGLAQLQVLEEGACVLLRHDCTEAGLELGLLLVTHLKTADPDGIALIRRSPPSTLVLSLPPLVLTHAASRSLGTFQTEHRENLGCVWEIGGGAREAHQVSRSGSSTPLASLARTAPSALLTWARCAQAVEWSKGKEKGKCGDPGEASTCAYATFVLIRGMADAPTRIVARVFVVICCPTYAPAWVSIPVCVPALRCY